VINVFVLLQRIVLHLQRYWMFAYLQLLRNQGAHIGRKVFARALSVEEKFARLLCIEDDVVFAYGVRIILHDSALNNRYGVPVRFGKVIVRKGAYIGARSIILPGVEIGEGAIVGAGSLVTRDIPPDSVAYGVPARVMGTTKDLKERFLEEMNRCRQQGRFYYLDVLPWRDRSEQISRVGIQQVYQEFLDGID
jgi:acyl-[acyl carrier protein]--UDP-N-acetylglucosamine O-acyltransferase